MTKAGILVGASLALATTGIVAHAFCGFYVAGSGQKMFNDATQVVLMRDGTRTVLSMQNDYRGPLEDFAMVVPVPVVLKPTDVKVLDQGVFARTDSLGSPRLVEYWEQDPCPPPEEEYEDRKYERRPTPTLATPKKMAPRMMADESGMGDPGPPAAHRARPAVPPVLASFSVSPPSVTADLATQMTWSFAYANEPWPTPSCTVDHGVGRVAPGMTSPLTLPATATLTLTCANSAGKSEKQVKVSAIKIEGKFDVAEYQILILSATEATGLEQWLTQSGYKIPKDAEPLLRPYIENGSKFFVAKVDPKKVHMVDGHAALSPLSFHYESEDFSLPIRLGMANSSGKQDLIVNILSADKRFEVANYKNVFIPTNFDVKPSVKTRFGEFYAALFDKTVEANPGAVVTEYAWTAVPNYHCDPCTDADITSPDLMALGADTLGGPMAQGRFVLTRLHARYGKSDMKDDLRFREAKPVTGGREQWGKTGLEYGAIPSQQNFFQARFAVRHYWTGPIACKNPQRNMWGGPPDGNATQTIAAGRTAFAPRGKMELATVIGRDLWEINYKRAGATPTVKPPATKKMGLGWLEGLGLIGLSAFVLRKRRS